MNASSNKKIFIKGLLCLAVAGASPSFGVDQSSVGYTYNAQGLIETIDGPRTDVTDVTTYAYNDKGQVVSITNALGQVASFSNYNAEGNPERIIDANGTETLLTYHARGWLLSSTIKDPQGNSDNDVITSYQYDAIGQLTALTLPNGTQLQYEYDAARRLTAVQNSLGERIEYTLDAAGNITGEIIKAGDGGIKKTLTRSFDELSRLIQLVESTGQATTFSYDVNGNRLNSTDALSQPTNQSVDALNRVVSVTDALNQSVTYTYDAQDRITSVTDPRGVQTTYAYDSFSNLTSLTSPDTGVTSFTHDAAGNVLSQTDARGVSVQYQYDALNRLISETYSNTPSLNKTYSYDNVDNGNAGMGHLTQVQDVSGTIDYTYDFLGRLSAVTRQIDGIGYTTTYGYNKAGQTVLQGYPDGLSLDFTRNSEGQITGLSATYPTSSGAVTQSVASAVAYLPYGPMTTLTYGNGVTLTRGFDQDYRLSQHAISGIETLNYTYNPVGSITAIDRSQESEKSQTFDYDALQRLTRESGGEGSKDYVYDEVGNRTQAEWEKADLTTSSQSITYASDSNRISSEDGVAVSYDAVGNITQRSNASGQHSFVYDEQNRLVSVQRDGEEVVAYGYNALGQRVQKLVSDSQGSFLTVFHYGLEGQLLGETVRSAATGKKTQSKSIVWIEGSPIAQLSIEYGAAETVVSSEWVYVHADHLNTPRVASSASQAVVWRWDSDAFGLGSADSDPDGDGHLVSINLRFPGQYFDEETGYYYNYYRDYDPSTGRYIQSDPMGLYDGPNTYLYVLGNPLMHTDPYGLFSMDPLWSVIYYGTGGWSPSNSTVNFVAGLGNSASFGLAGIANSALGQNVNTCSTAYKYGGYTALGIGVGRLAYAGVAKVGSKLAPTVASAVGFRQALKVTMRGGLFPNFRRKTYQQLVASGKGSAAIRASAGRTNIYVNTAGAQLATGGALTTYQTSCGCP